MKNKHTAWLIAFGILGALHLWAVWAEQQTWVYWTKPWLMPLLGVWFALEIPGAGKFARNTLLSALAFATAGDVLLMFAGRPAGALFFLLGLGAFLLTHFFYTGFFFAKDRRHNGFLRKKPLWGLPLIALTGGLMAWLWPDIPAEFQAPVIIYAATITAMALSVVNLYNQVSPAVFRVLFSGALLFLLSDSLLAVNKFGHAFEGAGLAVMATYLGGQFLLISGARRMLQ